MGWFGKKEKVPNIPVAPKLPDLPPLPEKSELPELPEPPKPEKDLIPPNNFGGNLNQEMNPVGGFSKRKEVEELPQDLHFHEESVDNEQRAKRKPLIPAKEDFPEFSERRTLELSPEIEPKTKSSEPIFVRIDKFQQAQKMDSIAPAAPSK